MKNTKTVKSQLGIEVERTEYSKPFCIDIKNNTDEKLFKVDVFNPEYKSQLKIGYSIPFDGVEYYDMLAMINAKDTLESGINIELIRIVALGDYKKFVNKQLSSYLSLIMKYTNGRTATDPVIIKQDLYQLHDNIVDIKYPFLLMQNTQIQLAYLMPELEVKMYLFPAVPKIEPLIKIKK